MKKSLLVLALLAGFVGVAAAQSSVTIYGKIDLAVGKASSSDDQVVADTSGSRIGFKGVEDLGNGNKAFFALEHRFSPDTGDSFNMVPNYPFWGGFAFVGLRGNWGAVTLGRLYAPTFTMVQNQVDPFAGETLAQLRHVGMWGGRGALPVAYIPGAPIYGAQTYGLYVTQAGNSLANFRINNAVRYDAKFGGFSFGVAAAERVANQVNGNVPFSVAGSYEAGPLYVGLGYEDPTNQYDNLGSLAVRYNFGWATLSAGATGGKNTLDMDTNSWILGGIVPWGSNDFKIGYAESKQGSFKYKKVGLGVQHNLSKRTYIFADVSYVGGHLMMNDERTGYDLGIQHNF
ncbi:MAG: porin [Proteobacteria bacterium]|nr:porin [Pseudomonadota bacterium]